MRTKRLPIGFDIFSEIRKPEFYYVDKTEFISKLIRSRGKVKLFTRPRRFGKTLMMTMLKSFFEIGSDPELFKGLAIEKDREVCEEYQGKYPVVNINLQSVAEIDYEHALESIRFIISDECARLSFLLDSEYVNDNDKEVFKLLLWEKSSEVELEYSLELLLRMLHAHYGKEVILLIEEYDVPLDRSCENGYYDKMMGFLRSFFGAVFKSNSDLEFAVVMGVLSIPQDTDYGELNTISLDSVSDVYFAEYFGFTDDEVKEILNYYGMIDKYDRIREWYGGYYCGETELYCPWDVANYCDDLSVDSDAYPQLYWKNTSSDKPLIMLFDKSDYMAKAVLERLLKGEAVELSIDQYFTCTKVYESVESLWSALYWKGYLTKDREEEAGKLADMRVRIPNKEIREILADKIKIWNKNRLRNSADELDELYHALLCGDDEKIEANMWRQLSKTIDYYDSKEEFYHSSVTELLLCNDAWSVLYSEADVGRNNIGVEDILGKFGFVIGLECAERTMDMAEKSEEALQRVEGIPYVNELMKCSDTVWAYGFAFAEKMCYVTVKMLK